MKKLFLVTLILTTTLSFSQIKKQKAATKIDAFTSKTGSIIKYIDYSLPNLKTSFVTAQTRVRKFIIGNKIDYFYQISKEGKYGTKTASIAYEDLIEVIKAMESLKNEVGQDKAMNPDYLENKFVTEDGFKLGYYVEKGKVSWYIVLEKYGSGNTIFLNKNSDIEANLNAAKAKIDELKNQKP